MDNTITLLEEFIGIESGDGVRVVRTLELAGDGDESEINGAGGVESVWCASDDGVVRRY